MYPHTIRLRGPWQFEALTPTTQCGPDIVTLPGFWSQQGWPDFWGRARLRRPFHWVAEFGSDESLWLWVGQVVGRATVSFNDIEIGVIDCPWATRAFDVTRLVRRDNEVTLAIESLPDVAERRHGSLGLEAPAGPRRPTGGVIGGVWLTIESRRLLLRDWAVAGGVVAGAPRLVMSASCQSDPEPGVGAAMPNFLTAAVDGEVVGECEFPADAAWRPLRCEFADFDVSPWRPRGRGLPMRQETLIRCQTAVGVWHERAWNVGFREPIAIGEFDSVGELWPSSTFAPGFGEEAGKPFDDWMLAQRSHWRMVGHVAPFDFYELADRVGLTLAQDVPLAGVAPEDVSAVLATLRRLACRPSVVGWRLVGGAESVRTRIADDLRSVAPFTFVEE